MSNTPAPAYVTRANRRAAPVGSSQPGSVREAASLREAASRGPLIPQFSASLLEGSIGTLSKHLEDLVLVLGLVNSHGHLRI